MKRVLLASTALIALSGPAAAGDQVMLRWQMDLGSTGADATSLALEYRPASAGILTPNGQDSAANLATTAHRQRPVARLELTSLMDQDDADRAYFAEADSTGEWMKKNWPWIAGGVGVAGLATWAIASSGDDEDDDSSDDDGNCGGSC